MDNSHDELFLSDFVTFFRGRGARHGGSSSDAHTGGGGGGGGGGGVRLAVPTSNTITTVHLCADQSFVAIGAIDCVARIYDLRNSDDDVRSNRFGSDVVRQDSASQQRLVEQSRARHHHPCNNKQRTDNEPADGGAADTAAAGSSVGSPARRGSAPELHTPNHHAQAAARAVPGVRDPCVFSHKFAKQIGAVVLSSRAASLGVGGFGGMVQWIDVRSKATLREWDHAGKVRVARAKAAGLDAPRLSRVYA